MKLSRISLNFLDDTLAKKLSEFLVKTVLEATNTPENEDVPLNKVKE